MVDFHHTKTLLKSKYSTGASDRSFYPIFNKRFDHLVTLLKICGPKKVLSAGSLCRPLVSNPQSKCPQKRPSCYPKSIMFHFKYVFKATEMFHGKQKLTNFMGGTWVRPPAKCWV